MFREELKTSIIKLGTVEFILFDDELNLYAMTLCEECQCDIIKKLYISGKDIENLEAIINSLGYDFISLKHYYENGIYDEYGNKMSCCCNNHSYKIIKVNFNKEKEEDYYMAWASL